MNILVQRAGLETVFKPENLSTPAGIQAAIEAVLAIEDEDYRLWGSIYLPEALAVAKQWDKAEETARMQHTIVADIPEEQVSAFREVASLLLADGQVERAVKLLHESEAIIGTIETPWQHAEALKEAARLLFQAGRSEDALRWRLRAAQIAQAGEDKKRHQDSLDASSVLKSICWDLAEAGNLKEAEEVALSIKNKVRRESALSGITTITKSR